MVLGDRVWICNQLRISYIACSPKLIRKLGFSCKLPPEKFNEVVGKLTTLLPVNLK